MRPHAATLHVATLHVATLLAATLLATAATAQPALRFTLASPTENQESLFGGSLAAVGDLDGDGTPDLVVSATDEDARPSGGAPVPDAGQVHVFSGATGALVRTFVSPNVQTGGFFGDGLLASTDADGDGVADVWVSASRETVGGASNAGRLYLLSGATGAALRAVTAPTPSAGAEFGFDLERLADLTGDGVGEIGVGSHLERVGGASNAGRLYILDGESGAALFTVQAPQPQADGLFGYTSAAAGDVTGDGVPDVFVGEPGRSQGALQLVGRAHLVSGASGEVVRTYASPTPTQTGFFGRWVAALGDVTGDGVPDLATGGNGEPTAGEYIGRAYVLSGADGAAVHTLVSPDAQPIGFFGELVEAVGDLDGDGLPDVLVSARAEDDDRIGPNVYIGRVYVYASATGALLATLKPPAPDPDGIQYFGYGLADLGDLNGDGRSEIGVGAWADNPDGSPPYAGRAYVFSGALAVSEADAPDAAEAALRVAPNPAVEAARLTASVEAPGRVRVDVVDGLGRVVAVVADAEQPAGRLDLSVDTSALPAGSYTVRLAADGTVRTVPLTVVR